MMFYLKSWCYYFDGFYFEIKIIKRKSDLNDGV